MLMNGQITPSAARYSPLKGKQEWSGMMAAEPGEEYGKVEKI